MTNTTSKEIARILLSIQAVTINTTEPYRYTSGLLSPVYSDMRLLIAYPIERNQVLDSWLQQIKAIGDFDVIAGTSTAGIPHAAWLADRLNKPMAYIRDKAKAHGKKNQIEGIVKPGQRVLIVEDLISTGGSSIGSVEAVREAGGIAEHITAIFNYALPASAEQFQATHVTLHALITFPEVIAVAADQGYIKPEQQTVVHDWLQDPSGWGARQGFEAK